MRHRLSHGEQVLYLDLNSGVSAQRALDQSLALLRAYPDLWDWDWIVAARIVPIDATVEQIALLARMFRKPVEPAVTVLVSEDRFLHLWARVMDFQFPGRRHLVVADMGEAVRLIGAAPPARKMNRI